MGGDPVNYSDPFGLCLPGCAGAVISQIAALAPGMRSALEIAAAVTVLPAIVVVAAEGLGGSAVATGASQLGKRALLELRVHSENNPAASFAAGLTFGAAESILKPEGIPPGTLKPPILSKSFETGYKTGKTVGAAVKLASKILGAIP